MSTSAETEQAEQSYTDETIQITTTYQELQGAENPNIRAVTGVTVTNTSTGQQYERGTDYEIDEANVSIRRTTTGSISSNEQVDVDYTVEYNTDRQQWGIEAGGTLWSIVALLILVSGAAFLLATVGDFIGAMGGKGGSGR